MSNLIGIFLISLFALSFGDKPEDECKGFVRSAYKQFQEFNNSTSKNTSFIEISISTLLSTGEIINSDNTFIKKGEKTIYRGSGMEIYDNGAYAVVVQHDAKIITFINDRNENMLNKNFATLQDSMLAYTETNYCSSKTIDNKEVRKINLKLNEKGREIFHINSIDYLLDKNDNKLLKTKVNYNNYKGISSLSYSFKKMNSDYQSNEISESNFNKYFDKDFLRSKYSNYTINDYRKTL